MVFSLGKTPKSFFVAQKRTEQNVGVAVLGENEMT